MDNPFLTSSSELQLPRTPKRSRRRVACDPYTSPYFSRASSSKPLSTSPENVLDKPDISEEDTFSLFDRASSVLCEELEGLKPALIQDTWKTHHLYEIFALPDPSTARNATSERDTRPHQFHIYQEQGPMPWTLIEFSVRFTTIRPQLNGGMFSLMIKS
ncbi:hypothetical protein FA15DRAFT_699018 [Coprinopsis marcescibilis]|uniref:Uncharacterized protein n=1 Tax=Coprinopsis marcescibilis TaxID=230819 RepID=A0A5C3LD48_COPMA|nr:hypothetical protein FA15DRAFT_699018 [Coprinopsis marcescibilis]